MRVTVSDRTIEERRLLLNQQSALTILKNTSDPWQAIQSGKIMAKAWVKSLSPDQHENYARCFVIRVIESYWERKHSDLRRKRELPLLPKKVPVKRLDRTVLAVASAIGEAAASLNIIEASYELGNVYTAVLPEALRSSRGIFYTPPSLTKRLMCICENAGVNWATAKVIDPACGGGAFLAPACIKIAEALNNEKPHQVLKHIESHVTGLEIDPFAAWLTQVFTEVALKDLLAKTGPSFRLQNLVRVCDSLSIRIEEHYDLVIGNPPYGKLKLTDHIRENFRQSLYGHPNYYGLFTHLALRLCKTGGVIAYLTPTSFLSGEYFKNLRGLLLKEAIPVEMDFVSVRKGVFEDVLQETMLSVYRKQKDAVLPVKVNQIVTRAKDDLDINNAGFFAMPRQYSAPWILPRTPEQSVPVRAMEKMPCRLNDWGYGVSTGPLVWNRHKEQLIQKENSKSYPVIWAEAITADGQFILRAQKKNHSPYFHFLKGDDWLITTKPCILLQRTTAKEQDKRLIAAALPQTLVDEKKGVVIENHLNMIIPVTATPRVSTEALAVFLNSKAANDAFRSISGSVAVSAYELESFPLPEPARLKKLEKMILQKAATDALEAECLKTYNILK